MIQFMIQKLLHKKWMVISLLIGNILLIAVACSNPVYKNASLQRAITKQFSDYIISEGLSPNYLQLESAITKEEGTNVKYQNMVNVSSEILSVLGLEHTETVQYLATYKSNAMSTMERADNQTSHAMRIATLGGIEDNLEIIAGKMYSSENVDGVYEAIMSQKAFVDANLILDEIVEFKDEKGKDGEPLRIKVVGVFTNKVGTDSYWVKGPNEYNLECFIDGALFEKQFINLEKQLFNIESIWQVMFDYTSVEPSNLNELIRRTERYMEVYNSKLSRVVEPHYLAILKEFAVAQNKTLITLLILQAPVFVLLCVFIFMISRQMLDLEQNEIALLKSRGSSKWQIISIYTLQSVMITGVSIAIGIPLGAFICQVLGSANGFLEFVNRNSLPIRMNYQVMLYCLGAAFISILVMVLPVMKDAGVTIVNVKQQKHLKATPFWQRMYLDVLMLLISIYGIYSFNDRRDSLIQKMLLGESVDPLLFLCSSLFIISAGLVALRIQPLLVRLIYFVGRNLWRPAQFASFLQILRTGSKQRFMMVFLILTVALGIYNATVARTIHSNSEKNITYTNGADLVLQEKWIDNSVYLKKTESYTPDENLELTYTEPDSKKFGAHEQVASMAKVLYSEAQIENNKEPIKATLMGIHTKTFGETINFDDRLLPEHINNYLNVLGSSSEYVLLSMNFKVLQEYSVGKKIVFKDENDKKVTGIVAGFFDYWPTYRERGYRISEEGALDSYDNYMIISNLSHLQEACGVTPYQVWLKTKGSSQFIYDFLEENNIALTEFKDSNADRIAMKNDTLFQGTNGILTMSFIVVLILCCAGFLIYWILSIRSRELLFGVFRAMGMKKSEIIQMLICEQIFSSGISIIIGSVIGLIASYFFVPLIQIFYSTTEQALPLEVVRENMDMIRLFGSIGVMILICMLILGVLISKINISQALKLGED